MIFSVYDHRAKRYDYFEDGRSEGTHAGTPAGVASGKIGVVPEAAAWRLPVAARKVGSGAFARGHVASRGAPAMAGIDTIFHANAVVMLGIGYLAYLALRRR